MNKKIASACIIVVMAVVIFETFYVNRAASQLESLKVTLWVSCGLNPLPKVEPSALDIVYVVIMAQPSGAAFPCTTEIFLRQGNDDPQLWFKFEQTSMYMGNMPVVWSTFAPTSEARRNLDIYVRVTDATQAVADQGTRIYLPSPTI